MDVSFAAFVADPLREVDEMIEATRPDVLQTVGPSKLYFVRLAGGPPTAKPVSVKVRGDAYADIRAAADTLREILSDIPGVKDIEDDADRGRSELVLNLDADAINRAALNPAEVGRTLLLLVDGIVVKLAKVGGIGPALRQIRLARELGLKVMLGCMVESSLAITAAAHLAPLVDYVDLDGHLLIKNDPFAGVTFENGRLVLPEEPGLGVQRRP